MNNHRGFSSLIILICTAFTLCLLSACGTKEAGKRDDSVLEAYRLIDEQRTDEAIQLLEDGLTKEPKNSEFKIVLASAYGHKAGIKIQKLVPVVMQSEKLQKMSEQTISVSSEQDVNLQLNSRAMNIAAMLRRFAGFFEVYSSIPLINKDQSVYLSHAIYLLNEVGPELKPADVLYRAILEIVLFKHLLSENFIGEFMTPKEKNAQTCKLDLEKVNETALIAGKLLIDIFNDLGFVDPEKAPQMKKLADQTSHAITDFTIATTTVTVLDEAANILLKQVAIQNNFGKIIKCGGGG